MSTLVFVDLESVGKNKSIGQRTAKQKKGEYDYALKIATVYRYHDHINMGPYHQWNQPTTDCISLRCLHQDVTCCKRKKKSMRKPLNILLSAITDRHLLTESTESAVRKVLHILSMLELHDATVSIEDANLKFLRSLPSVWHIVATMIRGQPGLDELDFDDLYNNLKVYEHELKGVSNSSSPNIAFMSTKVKGSSLKQSTAEPTNIPKGYTQAASSKVPTTPNYASHSDEIICSFFSQQASMPTTHNDEDLLQIDEDAMEESFKTVLQTNIKHC
ncbi:hypothetical protein Tco_0818827, partial [Tanacetum coccineum]